MENDKITAPQTTHTATPIFCGTRESTFMRRYRILNHLWQNSFIYNGVFAQAKTSFRQDISHEVGCNFTSYIPTRQILICLSKFGRYFNFKPYQLNKQCIIKETK